MKNFLLKSFEFVFLISFIIIFIGCFCFEVITYYKISNLFMILSSIFICGCWIFIYKIALKNDNSWSRKKEAIVFGIILFVFITCQFIIGYYLRVKPSWDVGVILSNAKSYCLYGSRLEEGVYPEYFQYYPNNIFIFLIYVFIIRSSLILKICKFLSFEFIVIIFNIFIVDIGIILLYLFLRKKFGQRNAIFGLILTLFFSPLILYTPICYTDTLSLPFGILIIYLYSIYNNENTNKIKNYLIFFGILASIVIGIKLKFTIIIIWLAILLDVFLNKNIKVFIKFLITSILAITICNFIYNIIIVDNEKFNFKQNDFGNIPYTHWIMMGIENPELDNSHHNSVGGYNEDDVRTTLSMENSEKAKEYNIMEIKNRIQKYGFLGFMKYLIRKACNAWGDGTYFASTKLSLQSEHRSEFLYNLFVINKENFSYYVYFAQGVQMNLLLIFIFNSIIAIKNKDYSNTYLRIAIFGILLFLLLWENRSRYLVNYIPLFIIEIVEFYSNLNRNKYFPRAEKNTNIKGV